MSKHTPGPWIAMEGGPLEGEMVITTKARLDLDMVSICDMDFVFEGEFGLEQEANAKLISAAPELLEALRILVATTAEIPGTHGLALDNARAAIAKATT